MVTKLPPQPKKHHQVPKGYLQQFCDTEGRIWVYDPTSKGPRPSLPINVSVETDRYSIIRDDGSRDTRVEDILADIDDVGPPAIRRMLAGDELDPQARMEMAIFVACLMLRTDTMRRQAADFHARMMTTGAQLMLSHDGAWERFQRTQAQKGTPVSPGQRSKVLELVNDPSRYEIHIRKDATMTPFAALPNAARLIDRMFWAVMSAPDGHPFITSDNPVSIGAPAEHGFYRGGLASRHTELTLALSPTRLLVAHWKEGAATTGECAPQDVKGLNRMVAERADRAVYADRNRDGLWRLATKYIRPRQEDPEALNVKVVRPRTMKRKDVAGP